VRKPRVLKSSSVSEGREASETASPAAASKSKSEEPDGPTRLQGYETAYDLEVWSEEFGWIVVADDVRHQAVPHITNALGDGDVLFRWKRRLRRLDDYNRWPATRWHEPA